MDPTNPSATPIAPEGMGPRSVFLLLLPLLGLGAFYWLSHDPNARDAFSDLKSKFDAPVTAAPAAAQPPAPGNPPNAGPAIANSPEKRDEERLHKIFEDQMARLEKEIADAKGSTSLHPDASSPLVFIAEPSCAPIGRQWLVSGHVSNPSHKLAQSRKATISLLIDGEPVDEQTVEVGPFEPQGIQSYEVLFRPSRSTRNHTVTAEASWEE